MRFGKRLLALVLAVTLAMSCGISTALAAGGNFRNGSDSGKYLSITGFAYAGNVRVGGDMMTPSKMAKAEYTDSGVTTEVSGVDLITYSSSDTGIATVNSNGAVKGLAVGSVDITATAKYTPPDSSTELTATKTVTITVDPPLYTVSFDADGGTPVPTNQKIEENKYANAPTEPTKVGFKFLGWYNGTILWSFPSHAVTANVTLKAKWEAVETLTVSFDAQGGTPVPQSQSVEKGKQAKEPSPQPTKTGYTFLGWYKGETKWNFLNTVSANITLTAKWEAVNAETFTVTFDPDNGSAVTTADYKKGDKITEPAAPVKDGFVFIGWKNGENLWDFESDTVAGTMTLKAAWDSHANEADLAALAAEIDAAKLSASQIVTSVNGTDVPTSTKWVTAEVKKAFTDAIALAEEVLDGGTEMSQTVVADATTAMKADHEAFLNSAQFGTRSGSGGNSGGSSSNGGSSFTFSSSPSQPTSKEVNSDGSVNAADTAKKAASAVQDALAANSKNAAVVIENAETISPAALKEIADAAKAAGGNVKLDFDTTVDGKTVARISIDPAKATALDKDINLSVSVDENTTAPVVNRFNDYFKNDVAVASFGQSGEFGVTVDVAVRVDVSKIDLEKLQVYSYDRATNKYVKVDPGKVFVDKNGFLHFQTNRGGDLLFSNGPLTAK